MKNLFIYKTNDSKEKIYMENQVLLNKKSLNGFLQSIDRSRTNISKGIR